MNIYLKIIKLNIEIGNKNLLLSYYSTYKII